MAQRSKIEWTDATWNPMVGCRPISPGCANCYAARMVSTRLRHLPKYRGLARDNQFHGTFRIARAEMEDPLRWKAPRRIFVGSMGDIFLAELHDWQGAGRFGQYGFDFLVDLFSIMRRAPWHTFILCTKRPAIAADLLPRVYLKLNLSQPLPNVILLTSVENQATADERIPALLGCPAAARGVSYEPALGPVDFSKWLHRECQNDPTGCARDNCRTETPCPHFRPHHLSWVIAGGESGPGARPAHPDWFRSVRDQCRAAAVPFFFKQWGEWGPHTAFAYAEASHAGRLIEFSLNGKPRFHAVSSAQRESGAAKIDVLTRLGKKRAGRLLDGAEHNGMPAVRS